MGTTNYRHTLIEPAEDCAVTTPTVPTERGGKPTVATLQYHLLAGQPYARDSDDVLFTAHALRKGIEPTPAARAEFFAKGQPCFRASPLTKQFGWSVHCDGDGRIALVAPGSAEHARLVADPGVRTVRAMRNGRRSGAAPHARD